MAPLITAFIGAIWLKEKLPNMYILIVATISSVVGIILICKPSFEQSDIRGVLCAVISMIMWSFVNLMVRTVIDSHFLQMELVTCAEMLFFGIPTLVSINHNVFDDEINLFDKDTNQELNYQSFFFVIWL